MCGEYISMPMRGINPSMFRDYNNDWKQLKNGNLPSMNQDLIVMDKDNKIYRAKYLAVCIPDSGEFLHVREVFVDLLTRTEIPDVYLYMDCPYVDRDWRTNLE